MSYQEIFNTIEPNYMERVFNDYRLPAVVLHKEFFDVQFSLIENYNGSGHTLKRVNGLIDDFGSINLFFSECSLLINKLKDYVTSEITRLNVQHIKDRHKQLPFKVAPNSVKHIYNDSSVGKEYIRLDINAACFSVFGQYTTAFKEFQTYKHLVNYFSEFDEQVLSYVADSKRLRNVIFGQANAKLAIYLEKFMISLVGSKLNEMGIDSSIVLKSHDELIIEYDPVTMALVHKALEELKLTKLIKVHSFKLTKSPLEHGYIENVSGEILFKGISPNYFLEEYATYFNIPMREEYKVFKHENSICKRILLLNG